MKISGSATDIFLHHTHIHVQTQSLDQKNISMTEFMDQTNDEIYMCTNSSFLFSFFHYFLNITIKIGLMCKIGNGNFSSNSKPLQTLMGATEALTLL